MAYRCLAGERGRGRLYLRLVRGRREYLKESPAVPEHSGSVCCTKFFLGRQKLGGGAIPALELVQGVCVPPMSVGASASGGASWRYFAFLRTPSAHWLCRPLLMHLAHLFSGLSLASFWSVWDEERAGHT